MIELPRACFVADRIAAEADFFSFETIDKPGVGWLVRLAAWTGREAKPEIQLGICGEHGGDPDSVAFFDMAGLDYVSCSPYRIPIARVAAAQAALKRANRV